VIRPSTLFASARRVLAPALALVALAGATTAQAVDELPKRWGPGQPASSYGQMFDDLFMLITSLISVSFLIVLVMLLVPVFRDRARKGHKAHYDHGSSFHDKRFTAIVSIIVFFVLDAWVLVVTMKDLREGFWNIPAPDDPEVVKMEVLAQQWAWNFRLPGVDGDFGTGDDIISINEMVVSVDRPVQMNLTSKDVIHALYLPDMRVKRDANPGAVNELWFEPITTGTYDILCAELCGFAHYQMHAKLRVLSEEDFDAWEQEASILALAAYDDTDAEAQWAWEWQE
jgi:cytochrome c oxidase subunit 2